MEHGVAELFEAACPARCARYATSGLRNSRRKRAKTPRGLPVPNVVPGGPALFGSSAPVTGGGLASGTVDTP